MEALLLKFGYLLLFVGVAVEGEFSLLAGAYLAHQGYFNIWLVSLIALLANWSAVQLYYAPAKSRGRPWLESRFGGRPLFQKILRLTGRHDDCVRPWDPLPQKIAALRQSTILACSE